jgi:hypothetical protein
MSQIPPQPPSPQSMPPAGYPAPAPRKTNGAAVGSLIVGLLGFCIPFLGGLIAVVLGFFGIQKAKDPQVGGKGMAIAGLILGLLSIGVWALAGGGVMRLIRGTAAEREVAKQFITDVAAGNTDAALAKTDGTIQREEVQDLTKTVQGWGSLKDVTTAGFSYSGGRCQVAGVATFGETSKPFEMNLVESGEDVWKVSSLEFK